MELQNVVKNLEVCRLCLNLTVAKVNIFTDDFAKMIEILTSLKVKPDDSLPQISCLKCAREVKGAFLLRRRIIQSHRAFTRKMMQIPSYRDRNITEVNNGATTSTDSNTLTPSVEPSPQLVERPFRQLQSIIQSSVNAGNSMAVSDEEETADSTLEIEKHELESSEIDGQELENKTDDAEPISQSHTLSSSNHIGPKVVLSSVQCEQIQNLKLAINTKYSNMINTCKQKLSAWKLMNTKDQKRILRWLEKKNLNAQGTRSKSKLATTVQYTKKDPMKMYCNICQIKFTNKIKYRNHMTRHKIKTCPVCNKQIRSAYLKKHMTLHEDSPAMCEICGITCKNPCSLRMHFFYYHKSCLSVCEDCGRSFKTKTKLLYHQRKDHTKERNFKCETCGKGFFDKMYLTKHINMKHKKLRPHICEYCGRGFSGKHALRTHIRQHTNEAPYQCNFCEERFRQRVSLRGHLKSRHKIQEENKVFCDTCGKGFASDVALDVHSRLHSEIRCPFCTDTFAENTYLEQHIFNVHSHEENHEEPANVGWMSL